MTDAAKKGMKDKEPSNIGSIISVAVLFIIICTLIGLEVTGAKEAITKNNIYKDLGWMSDSESEKTLKPFKEKFFKLADEYYVGDISGARFCDELQGIYDRLDSLTDDETSPLINSFSTDVLLMSIDVYDDDYSAFVEKYNEMKKKYK